MYVEEAINADLVLCDSLQSPNYRGLVSLGIGSVGGAPVAGCKSPDATRLGVIITGMRGGVLLTEELLANGLPIDGISGSLVAGVPSSNPLAIPADPVSRDRLLLKYFISYKPNSLMYLLLAPCLGCLSAVWVITAAVSMVSLTLLPVRAQLCHHRKATRV